MESLSVCLNPKRDVDDMRSIIVAGFLLALASLANAEDLIGVADSDRAHLNYMLNCQGCHGQTGSASMYGAVPAMENYVGYFLHVPGGRAFLVQVPGSANAAISDAALAELLNWILQTQSPEQLPSQFQPFTEAEIRDLRQHAEIDVSAKREKLVEAISRLG